MQKVLYFNVNAKSHDVKRRGRGGEIDVASFTLISLV